MLRVGGKAGLWVGERLKVTSGAGGTGRVGQGGGWVGRERRRGACCCRAGREGGKQAQDGQTMGYVLFKHLDIGR